MSTRATVYVHWVQHNTVKLYHHCDGYVSWLGTNIVDTMINCGGENVIENLFKIGGFEVDDVDSIHSDVEYVYDIYVKHDSIKMDDKYQARTSWRVEVRKWYDEEKIKEQEGVEIGDGWSMMNYNRDWNTDKIEDRLSALENRWWDKPEDEVVESVDTDSSLYNAYYS